MHCWRMNLDTIIFELVFSFLTADTGENEKHRPKNASAFLRRRAAAEPASAPSWVPLMGVNDGRQWTRWLKATYCRDLLGGTFRSSPNYPSIQALFVAGVAFCALSSANRIKIKVNRIGDSSASDICHLSQFMDLDSLRSLGHQFSSHCNLQDWSVNVFLESNVWKEVWPLLK